MISYEYRIKAKKDEIDKLKVSIFKEDNYYKLSLICMELIKCMAEIEGYERYQAMLLREVRDVNRS
jgi:hypothetical protein